MVAGTSFALAAALVGLAVFTTGSQAVVTDDTHFYGQSPPVYPSPETLAHGDWEEAIYKARELVSRMTLEEKVSLTAGVEVDTGCSGMIAPVERVSFPGLCLHDAGQGVRNADFVNSWPSGIHIGASWNKALAYKRALAMGGEFRRKGVQVMLGPVVGPIGRVVRGGRNWEGISPDPYLSGVLVHELVAGTQDAGVIASTKHYIGNEQEVDRMPTKARQAVSSNIDDVTMHELYLWPFQDAVHAGSGSIMCSYQRLNNSYGCQNSKALNGLLKEELGFQGFVVTDWLAAHSGVGSALAGLDMIMPLPAAFFGDNLTEAVNNGSVPEQRVTDMVVRILASWYKMGQDVDYPAAGVGIPMNLAIPHEIVEGRKKSDKPVLFQSAVEGHVLVKNINNALPLRQPRALSVLGYGAKDWETNMVGNPSAWTFGFQPTNTTELREGVTSALAGVYPNVTGPARGGAIVSGGGSGATSIATFMSPFNALLQRAEEDDTQIFWDFKSGEPEVLGVSDACLVFVNAYATETMDRPGLRDDYTDVRLVDQWIDHPNVTAVVLGHLGGQYAGKAIVSLLYGDENFSGKLPYTVAKNESDYGHLLDPTYPEGDYTTFPQSDFDEGVYIDYRRFDKAGIEPRYEFGFGMSYTNFTYSNMHIRATGNHSNPYPQGPIMQGGHVDLWDPVAVVTADVKNTGAVDGSEVAQLYVGIPGAPARQLRGVEKPEITAGETASVMFQLTRRDLSVWDVVAQKWNLQSGNYSIFVGPSSRSFPLSGSVFIGHNETLSRRAIHGQHKRVS
ncbi:hypothetical protein KVR01_013065 [Diaporthe batatas]|uniref:uncharacterized protein n=1 Tax=Diaporthe batatas TaxID=748121 RepID=UPI001D04345D|nr:uncharacterized protein KVR01_013065 [Diaporthe batatas]KAG8157075.1 hypothetical protein KVR01_013065 [Diaporthe batatas]